MFDERRAGRQRQCWLRDVFLGSGQDAQAEVLALGTGKDDEGKDVKELFTVKKGDKVLISKYGGTEVKLNGDDVLIINETDILGIVS